MFMGKVCKGKLVSCCSKGKVKVIWIGDNVILYRLLMKGLIVNY